MYQRGRNSGVTGLADIQGTPQFGVRIYSFQQQLTVNQKRRRGRGVSGKLALTRALEVGGQLILSGDVHREQYPVPVTFEGSAGSITLQFHAQGSTVSSATIPVRVDVCAIGFDDKKADDYWKITLTCTITGQPTWQGFGGTQPAASTDTSLADSQIIEQNSKNVDPWTILDEVTRVWDVVALTDTDAGEHDKLVAMISAAVAPYSGLKLKSITMTARDAFGGGTVTESWSRTTSADDIVNPNTIVTVDQSGLETVGQVTTLNATPTAPSGQVIRKISTQKVNDQVTKYTAETGLEYIQSERERKASSHTIDDNMLTNEAAIATISPTQPADPTPPSGTVFDNWETQKTEDGRTMWIARCKPRNCQQDIEYQSKIHLDASTLASDAVIIQVQDTDAANPPSPPFAGAVYTDYTRQQLTWTDQPRWQYTYNYAYETNAQKIIRENSSTTLDPQSLSDVQIICQLDDDSAPSTPTGYRLRKTDIQDLPNNHHRYVFTFSRTDSKDDIEYDGHIELDLSGLESAAILLRVQDSPTPAWPDAPFTNAVPVKYRIQNKTQLKYVLAYTYGLETTQAKREREASDAEADDNLIVCRARIGIINATRPATPTAPAGTTLYDVQSRKQEDGRYLWVFDFRPANSQQAIEWDSTVSTDASTLDSRAELYVVQSTNAPSTPATPFTGGVLTDSVHLKQVAPNRYVWKYLFAYETNAQKIVRENSHTDIDPNALADAQVICQLDNATPPATPDGYRLLKTETQNLPNSHIRYVFTFTRKDSKDEIEFESVTEQDVSGLSSSATVIVVQANATLSWPAAPFTNAVGVRSRVKQLTAAGKYAVYYTFGYETEAARIIRENTHTDSDPNAIADVQVLCTLDDAVAPATPSGFRLRKTEVQNLPNSHTRRIYTFTRTDTKDEIEYDGHIEIDLSGLDSGAVLLRLQDSSAPSWPAAPFTNAVQVKYRVQNRTAAKYVLAYTYGYESLADKLAREGTHSSVDPQAVESDVEITLVDATPTLPAGYVETATITQNLPNGHYKQTIKGAKSGSMDKRLAAKSEYVDDKGLTGQNLRFTHIAEAIPVQGVPGTVPSTPTPTIAGVELVQVHRELVPENPAIAIWRFMFGYRDSAEAIADQESETSTDPSTIEDHATVSVPTGYADALPSTPTAPIAGQVVTMIRSQRRGMRKFWLFHFGWETEAQKLAREATRKLITVDGIGSKETTAAVDGAAPASTAGLSLAGTETEPLANGHYRQKKHYDEWGGEANREAGLANHGEADLVEYEKWHAAEIVTVATTADLKALIEARVTAAQTDITFGGVSGRMIAPNKGLVITTSDYNDKVLLADFHAERIQAKAVGTYVYVSQAVAYNSTWTRFMTARQTINRVTGTIIYQRKLSSAHWYDNLNSASMGCCNNGAVLGIAAGYAMFGGAKARSNEYITGDHVRVLEYILHFDTFMFLDDSQVGEPGHWHTTNASFSAPGFVAASSFGWTISAPARVNLGFITA